MESEYEHQKVWYREAAGWKTFSSLTRYSRRVFLCVYGLPVDQGHGVMFPLAVWRLRR